MERRGETLLDSCERQTPAGHYLLCTIWDTARKPHVIAIEC